MVIGKVGKWIATLQKGKAVVLDDADLRDSARAYMDSGFDFVRPEHINKVIAEVNSSEYPEFEMRIRVDGRWILQRF